MSDSPRSSSAADRNLLFGILALQMDFITSDQLVAAMNSWVLSKSKPLGTILHEHGALATDQLAALDSLVNAHVNRHGNDPKKSLAALSSVEGIRRSLVGIADTDVQASLICATKIDPSPYGTMPQAERPTNLKGSRFRILRPHARGGLGEVFVANDEELNREVALKEIQPLHAFQQDFRSRFVREAEITGGLEHPGIVPVYGLGAYADGRPFYAMRFIKGDSMQAAIRRFHEKDKSKRDPQERSLALRELLGRFVDVCQAIAYAHSRGVLHRDLKPGNVMLGKYGETLVVDWGLAKATSQVSESSKAPAAFGPMNGSSTGASMADTLVPPASTETDLFAERPISPRSAPAESATQMGQAVGTPGYMSPEQAAGRLDHLGPASDVYSLGATLYHLLTGRPPFEEPDVGLLLSQVQRGEFRRPREISRIVSPALEAICLKALALKPSDRFAGAQELASEIERWLADEPVRSYSEPWAVRARRWTTRHRTLVTTGVACTLVAVTGLAVGLALVTAANERERAARSQETIARRDAEKQRDLAESNFKLAQDAREAAEAQSKIAKAEAIRADQEAASARVTAQVLTEMFEATDPLGLNGIPALKLRGSEDLSTQVILARGATRVLNTLNNEPIAQAKLLDTIGSVYCDLGKLAEAKPLLTKALGIRQRMLSKESPDLATSYHNLGWLHHQAGDYTSAERLYRDALIIRRLHADADPSPLAATLFTLGWLLADADKLEDAAALFKEALQIRLQHLGPNNREVAVARVGLVAVYFQQRKFVDAIWQYEQAIKTLREVEGGKGLAECVDLFQHGLLIRDFPAARLVLGLKKEDSAVEYLRRAEEMGRKTLRDQHPLVGLIAHELGIALEREGKLEEAEKAYRDCLAIIRLYGLDHPKAPILLGNFCWLLFRRGKQAEAIQYVDQALEAHSRHETPLHASIGDLLVIKAELVGGAKAQRLKLLEQALDHYCLATGNPRGQMRRCLDRLEEMLPPRELVNAACRLVRSTADRTKADERDRYLELAMETLQAAKKKGFKDVGRLREEPDLQKLVGRPDFEKLVSSGP